MNYKAKHLAVDIAELLRKCSAGKITHRQSALASITAYEMLTHDNTYPLENMLKDIEKGAFNVEVKRALADLQEYVAWSKEEA